MNPQPAIRATLVLVATLASLTSLPAQAVGGLTDVQVIDRDSGETLTVYRHQGEHWVAGRPGARYAVSVRNATPGRVLGVVSVDGVNVISGETAAWRQTGYVLSPWQQHAITGWRKSDTEVAAFHFTASSDSYAERTGRPAHVGVIGVAVFREKPLPPPPPAIAPSPLTREQGAAQESRSSAPASAADMARPRLGTGHGERETSVVGHTTFERRSQRPDELIRIRYDSRENLVAMGIIPMLPMPPRPNPFPGAVLPGYAPDPG
ncbi:MAG: hypothetical protein AB7S86_05035 [Hydrogenophaga sp.]|uniref:hypothetical protein n=1 Tax=Hydrogenophaga sp. TaxID=1904254 RepID=UPI003D14C508